MLTWKSSALTSNELNEFGEIFTIKNNKIVSPLIPSAIKSALEYDFDVLGGHCDVNTLMIATHDIWYALVNRNHLKLNHQSTDDLNDLINLVKAGYKGLIENVKIFEKSAHINLASINPKKLSDETSDDSCLVSNYLSALIDKRILNLLKSVTTN